VRERPKSRAVKRIASRSGAREGVRKEGADPWRWKALRTAELGRPSLGVQAEAVSIVREVTLDERREQSACGDGGARGTVARRARGRERPTMRRRKKRDPPKRGECREALPLLGTRGALAAPTRVENRRDTGARSRWKLWEAEVGRTHRAARVSETKLQPGSRKANRARVASRKETLTSLTHERVETRRNGAAWIRMNDWKRSGTRSTARQRRAISEARARHDRRRSGSWRGRP